jgi:hypothetical protein
MNNDEPRGLFYLLTPEGKTAQPEPEPEPSNVIYVDFRKPPEE